MNEFVCFWFFFPLSITARAISVVCLFICLLVCFCLFCSNPTDLSCLLVHLFICFCLFFSAWLHARSQLFVCSCVCLFLSFLLSPTDLSCLFVHLLVCLFVIFLRMTAWSPLVKHVPDTPPSFVDVFADDFLLIGNLANDPNWMGIRDFQENWHINILLSVSSASSNLVSDCRKTHPFTSLVLFNFY